LKMKNLLLTIVAFCVFIFSGKAQEASVEKSIWGIRVGIPPIAVSNETGLTKSITLLSEFGFGFAWSSSSGLFVNNTTSWAVIPVVNIEPRYYYNLKKRLEKGKRIDGNSGNFLALSAGFSPDFGITSDNVDLDSELFVIPMWGLKRNLGKNFTFESAVGLGYSWVFNEYTYNGQTVKETEGGTSFSLRFGFGYRF